MANFEKRNREKILAVITIIVVLGALIFSTIIEPQLIKRKNSLENMYQLQLKLTKMNTDVRIKDRIEETYSIYEPYIASIGKDSQDISVFARELRYLYKGLKINNRNIRFNPTIKEEFFTQFSVKIEMTGNIKDVLYFMCNIDTYDKPLHIESLDITSQEITDNVKATFVITKVVAEAGV